MVLFAADKHVGLHLHLVLSEFEVQLMIKVISYNFILNSLNIYVSVRKI